LSTGPSSDGSGAPHVRVAIVGTGFSGLGAAIRLKQAGIDDFLLFERAADLGGTWRDNDYPGCCCDVPSHLYSFSFELNRKWTHGFAGHAEIWAYLKATAQKYGVASHIRYRHEVIEAAWDDSARRWEIETTGGRFTAQLLVPAVGPLADPSIPDVPGVGAFKGKMFHSALWEHDHDLTGERVAVIGTGASAIQFVPEIQPQVGQLHLFQRTAPWLVPRLDHEITRPELFLLRWIPFAAPLVRLFIYLLLEGRVLAFRHPRYLMKIEERVARWHLKRQVPDPELRAKLTPDYTVGCKRILIASKYFPSLTQPNVEVLNSGISEIRERSVVAQDGSEREVDTIIWGTGFHVTDPPIAPRVRGRAGHTLAEHWTPSMKAYNGAAIAGFPNLFMILGPNTGLGHSSMVLMIESQINYLMGCLRAMDERGADTFEVREDVEEAYNEELQRALKGTVWSAGNCKSWYLDSTGRNTTLWTGWTWKFRNRLRQFDADSYVLANGSQPQAAAAAAAVTPER
jgi:cation diffusion facilitator CzcD-associated flavoprotein CzcO